MSNSSVALCWFVFFLNWKRKNKWKKNTYENSIRQCSHLLCASPFQIMQYPLSETPNQSFMRSTMVMRESQGVWLSYCIWCVQFTLHWQRHPRDQQQKLEETKCVYWMIRGGLIEGMSSKMMHSNVLFSSLKGQWPPQSMRANII